MPRTAFPGGRKAFFLLVLTAIIIGGGRWSQRPPPEPVLFNNKLLSVWVYGTFGPTGYQHPEDAKTIRAYGPSAITWLAYIVEHGRHPYINRGSLPFEKAPVWLRQRLPASWGGLRGYLYSMDERTCAARALTLLGPKAAPAIPALAESLDTEVFDGNLYDSAVALCAIGPKAWPVIQQLLEHGRSPARLALIDAMQTKMGTDEQPKPDAEVVEAMQALVKASRDPDARVRTEAVGSIRNCRSSRRQTTLFDFIIPDLLRLLSDSDSYVRELATDAIEMFDVKASAAFPRLLELLDDPDCDVRRAAAYAMHTFDVTDRRSAARLGAMLYDSDKDCRNTAAMVLDEFGIWHDERGADELDVSPAQ